jgi:hypothetical protein
MMISHSVLSLRVAPCVCRALLFFCNFPPHRARGYLSSYIPVPVPSFLSQVLFVAVDDGVLRALASSSPPLILAALSSMEGPRRAISSLDCESFLLGPLAARSCCVVPLAMAMHLSLIVAADDADATAGPPHFDAVPTIAVCLATLLLMRAYHANRSHKHGCLLTSEMKSQSIFAGVSMFLSISISMTTAASASSSSSDHVVIAFLLGSALVTLACHVYASVADVWYPVGSGQFLMVSLDTSGMVLFFACPAALLLLRFLDMHAGEVSCFRATLAGGYARCVRGAFPPPLSAGGGGGAPLPLALAMALVSVSVVGVPLLNSLCPLGGYLYSRAYMHGRPNTGRVALCVNYRDLPKGEGRCGGGGDDDLFWDSLSRKRKEKTTTGGVDRTTTADPVLNVFVTPEDIARYPNELRAVAGRGHALELAPSEESDGAHRCGPSIFSGKRAVRDLRNAHREYAKFFGEGGVARPRWMLSRSASSFGRHPSVLREASDLGMKVAYWSTSVVLTNEDRLTSEQRSSIGGDIVDKNGGSIIYITLGGGVSSNCVSGVLCELINILDGQYSLVSLSDVARDDAEMVLKR